MYRSGGSSSRPCNALRDDHVNLQVSEMIIKTNGRVALTICLGDIFMKIPSEMLFIMRAVKK